MLRHAQNVNFSCARILSDEAIHVVSTIDATSWNASKAPAWNSYSVSIIHVFPNIGSRSDRASLIVCPQNILPNEVSMKLINGEVVNRRPSHIGLNRRNFGAWPGARDDA